MKYSVGLITRNVLLRRGKKRREKEVGAMWSAPVSVCSESVKKTRPKYIDYQSIVKQISVVHG